jgi:hypothetical protein
VSLSYWRHVVLTCRVNKFHQNGGWKIDPESKT